MFTGIIEELGRVESIVWHGKGAHLVIESPFILSDSNRIKVGDSLAVNGCCLTVTALSNLNWTCDVVQETMEKTNLCHLQVDDLVNVERSVKLQDRLNGHLVQGHIDGTGKMIVKDSLEDNSYWVTIQAPPSLLKYVVYKGSIAVDGVSLTVTQCNEETLSFTMIPHTAKITNLGFKKVGDYVNLEVDLMAKYAERLLSSFLIGKKND